MKPNTMTKYLRDLAETTNDWAYAIILREIADWIEQHAAPTSGEDFDKFIAGMDLLAESQRLHASVLAAEEKLAAAEHELTQHDCAAHVGVRETIETLKRERDEARSALGYARQQVESLHGHIKGLKAPAPPTVCTVDIEAAAERLHARMQPYGGTGLPQAVEIATILRSHARPADAEALAEAITIEVREWPHDQCQRAARAALAHLGLALAEKPRLPSEEELADALTASRADDGRPRSELVIESDRRHARAVRALLREARPAQEPRDAVLEMPSADAGPLARAQQAELHRLLAPVLDAAAFAPGQEKAEDAIRRLLGQWRSGMEPRVPAAPRDVLAGVDREKVARVIAESRGVHPNVFDKFMRDDQSGIDWTAADAALASIREQIEARETRKEGT